MMRPGHRDGSRHERRGPQNPAAAKGNHQRCPRRARPLHERRADYCGWRVPRASTRHVTAMWETTPKAPAARAPSPKRPLRQSASHAANTKTRTCSPSPLPITSRPPRCPAMCRQPKTFGGNRTPAGARTQEIITGVIATAATQRRDVIDYLAERARGRPWASAFFSADTEHHRSTANRQRRARTHPHAPNTPLST